MRPLYIALAASSLLAAACSASDVGGDQGYEPDTDFPVSEDVPLEVDAPTAPTYWGTIPVTGHGPANGTLVVATLKGPLIEELSSSGDFCIDIPLEAGVQNTIEFEAIADTGVHSPVQTIQIYQQGSPPPSNTINDDGSQVHFTNIAVGARVNRSSVVFEEGSTSDALFDTDPNGIVTIRNTVSPWSDWMIIPLNQQLPIEQVKIRTTIDCPMEEYKLLTTDKAQPADPMSSTSYHDDWKIVATVTDGTASQSITPQGAGSNSRFLAVEFLSRDCGPTVGAGKHKVTEIEVWGRGISDNPDNSGPPIAPTCFGN